MATFTPPTDNIFNLSDFDVETPWGEDKRRAYRLLRHIAPQARGRNVFKLDDGTYVENEPADMSTVTITYYGGHDHPVDADEFAALTAAGYGDYIS